MKVKLLYLLVTLYIILTGCGQVNNSEEIPATNTIIIQIDEAKSNQSQTNNNVLDADVINQYQDYLKTLSVHEIESSGAALEKCISLIRNDISLNDSLFRLYKDFYIEVCLSQDLSVEQKYKDKQDYLNINGYDEFNTPGNEWAIVEKPGFLIEKFTNIVSEGMLEYLNIINNEDNKEPTSIDGYMAISWSELENRILVCESYLEQYSLYPEAQEIQGYLSNYIQYYITAQGMFLEFLYKDGRLTEEAQSSYEHFISSYPDSKYHDLIDGYYQLLKSNNFTLSDKIKEHLEEQGIDISWFDAGV